MINIVLSHESISISGHAQYGKYGNDIVCAAISAISLSALNWFDPSEIIYSLDNDGNYYLKLAKVSKSNLEKLSLLKIQLKAIQQQYQDYINIEGE